MCACVTVGEACVHTHTTDPPPPHITNSLHNTTQVIQAAKISGARRIIAIDTNPAKFSSARAMGATDCVDPTALDVPIQQHIVAMTQVSFSFCARAMGATDCEDHTAVECEDPTAIEMPSNVQISLMT